MTKQKSISTAIVDVHHLVKWWHAKTHIASVSGST